jgi:hypothetical protein
MRRLLAIGFLLAQPAGWKPPAVRIQDEGEVQGYASTLNCVGAGISCSVGASVATVSVTGGGGGGATPSGSSGNVQINNAGAFGVYGGTTCSYAVKSLDANGAATCTAAPSIPADVSSARYVTTQAEAGLSAEAVLPTCSGTDKLTFNGTTIACATDQTGGGGAPVGATYITQTSDATLTGEQALSALGTGLVKNTTGTGVLSIGASGTDYAPATSGSAILKGNGAGGFSNAVAGTDYQAPLTLPLSIANGGTNSEPTAVNGAIVYSTGDSARAFRGRHRRAVALLDRCRSPWMGRCAEARPADGGLHERHHDDEQHGAGLDLAGGGIAVRVHLPAHGQVERHDDRRAGRRHVLGRTDHDHLRAVLRDGGGHPPSTAGTHSVIAATANSTALGTTAGLTTYTIWRLEGIIVHTASASTVTIRAKASGGTITIGSGSNCQYSSL